MRSALLSLSRQRRTPFLGSNEDYGSARVVMIGAPMDCTSSYRPGSRFGPAAVREVSEAIEEYSPYRDRSLGEVRFYDAGDLILPYGNVAASLAAIGTAVELMLGDGKMPLMLGGEHLVTSAAVRSMYARFPDLCLLQFDAHADLRRDYLGEQFSHTAVMRLAHEILGDGRIYQFGIRSGERDEFAFAAAHTRLCRGGPVTALQAVEGELGRRPVYVTLDIDVVDPSCAPGTGTPECGGPTSAELLPIFDCLARLRVVGFDLVEILPAADFSARTALLAAVLAREALLIMA